MDWRILAALRGLTVKERFGRRVLSLNVGGVAFSRTLYFHTSARPRERFPWKPLSEGKWSKCRKTGSDGSIPHPQSATFCPWPFHFHFHFHFHFQFQPYCGSSLRLPAMRFNRARQAHALNPGGQTSSLDARARGQILCRDAAQLLRRVELSSRFTPSRLTPNSPHLTAAGPRAACPALLADA